MRSFLLSVLVVVFVFGVSFCGFGQSLEWAIQIGENDTDYGIAIDVDKNGNVYSTGTFQGNVDFDPGPNSDVQSAIAPNYYISKLNSEGELVWAVTPGNPIGSSHGTAIKVDTFGNVYTCGYFQNIVDFDPDTSSYNLISNGYDDIFISKLDSNGNLLWARNFGGIDGDYSKSIDIDLSGNVYLTGGFKDTVDFNPDTLVTNQLVSNNSSLDVFILKLNSSGDFLWVKQVGGNSLDLGESLKIDNLGNVCVTGVFSGIGDFNPGNSIENLSSTGSKAVFILKLNNNGDFIWAKSIDVLGSNSISIGNGSDIVISGLFNNTVDFDPNSGVITQQKGGIFQNFY